MMDSEKERITKRMDLDYYKISIFEFSNFSIEMRFLGYRPDVRRTD